MKLLLIEDEVGLSEALSFILKKNNYSVDVAYDGLTGQAMAETGIYDLIILDRMLPGKEGLEVLQEIRKKGVSTPVLILTAKDSVDDKVDGLNTGADDYLVKPFEMEELLARLRALGRRKIHVTWNNEVKESKFSFDPYKGEIKCDNNIVRLSKKEAQIMEILLRNKNQVLNKQQILDHIFEKETDNEMDNLEIHLSCLRKKLISAGCKYSIETVRGAGYCLKEAGMDVSQT